MKKNILIEIVKTWQLKELPEYRGFRCANCQRYMGKAWYHWLDDGEYKTPVHFCAECEKKYKLSKINIKNPQAKFNKKRFGFEFSEKIKAKITKIANGWNNKSEPIYKIFSCDNCGKDMTKAYHVWANSNNVLIETHFCRDCGEDLELHKIIVGIIYDLDGTLISTVKLHESAWLAAGKKFNIPITKEMLLNQKGISNEAASLMILPENEKNLLPKLVKIKKEYVMKNAKNATVFPGAIEMINQLKNKGYKIWICTSAKKDFVRAVFGNNRILKNVIGDNVVWREMYKKEKPSADALNLTIAKIALNKSQVCYIGDSFNDYKTSMKAGVKFIYFFQQEKDLRIPEEIPAISHYKNIFRILK